VEFVFQVDDTIQLTNVRIRERTTGKDIFEVSRILRGARAEYIALPRIEVLQLPIIEWSFQEDQAGMLNGFFVPLTHAIVGQAAVADAQFRKLPLFSTDVNWSAVQSRAESTGKPISDLIGLPLGALLGSESATNKSGDNDTK
jgi:hypothetical protein